MRQFAFMLFAVLLGAVALADESTTKAATDQYVVGRDSKPQPGVPKGVLSRASIVSQVFGGRTFTYHLYVPAQYDGVRPAAVFVGQDGSNFVREPGAWHVPVVFDNLIHQKDMPVTIGIFIDPSSPPQRAGEYDTLSDRYARFVIEEILPEVGKTYLLTRDPDGRAIAGFSSGAICAFTVAWERPDAFRKVVSFFGSFTSIGYQPATADKPMEPGGDLYPTLIRRSPIKPLTVFLQDGSNDLNNSFGSWWLANQQMLAALEWANANADHRKSAGPRYRVHHVWGDGGHTANHGGAIFPDVMRWLWQGYEPRE